MVKVHSRHLCSTQIGHMRFLLSLKGLSSSPQWLAWRLFVFGDTFHEGPHHRIHEVAIGLSHVEHCVEICYTYLNRIVPKCVHILADS